MQLRIWQLNEWRLCEESQKKNNPKTFYHQYCWVAINKMKRVVLQNLDGWSISIGGSKIGTSRYSCSKLKKGSIHNTVIKKESLTFFQWSGATKHSKADDLQVEMLPLGMPALKWVWGGVGTESTSSGHSGELPTAVLPGLAMPLTRCTITGSSHDLTDPTRVDMAILL